MSDLMRPMSFGKLMTWIMEEYKKSGSIFGISKIVRQKCGHALPIFREKIESPFGPAAGPNTQLAQNIIAAYVAGARFFELKTVQIMDGAELAACVSKPCITAADEGYNCEWSTELYVPQAYNEYVKAWVACKILAKEYGLGDPDGFVFNMSVGYDLEGIKSEKINAFIDNMKEAKDTPDFKECISWALENADCFEIVDEEYIQNISSVISESITESTLHGCPPDEIERIATYLITEKNLNTFVKCNPTLLGYEYARTRLDSLGFDYVAFDDHHFLEDLQWNDAIPMFRRLMKLTAEKGLEFGVKLTNTFPVDVKANELPGEEMYMSGRALFPLTIHLARLLTREFNGALRISYSGGAAVNNMKEIFDAGIWPVTMATNILKPGGYQRMSQIADLVMECGNEPFKGVDPEKLAALDDNVAENAYYRKPVKPLPERKIGKKLPLFECFTAPCRNGCPIEQDIPAYLKAMSENDPEKALEIILERNALPFITGTICPHHCGDKCMRNYYEDTLRIRETKLSAANAAFDRILPTLKSKEKRSDKKVAVIGAGPAGLSAASFLSRAGIPVTVFEQRKNAGGIVRNVIPSFRISEETIEKDIALCKAYGTEIQTNVKVESVKALKEQGFTDVIIAVGAWKPGNVRLEKGETLDAVDFLETFKTDPGKYASAIDIVVLGGGNTAMDTARAALRIKDVEHVRLVYRRTKRYMPADEEELCEAVKEGVEFMELLAPIAIEDGFLKCSVMELGESDASGRRSPVDTGKVTMIPADLVIAAVGEQIDGTLYESLGVETDPKGRPVVNDDCETSVKGVYAAGDSRRGPATVVEAIADAQKAAAAIAGINFDRFASENKATSDEDYKAKKGVVAYDVTALPDERCLGCPTVCEVCADVCPNRANVAIRIPGHCQDEVIHMDGMCNECGNCAVFCPYNGRPYKDKFTLFWSEADLDDSENEGFAIKADGEVVLRLDGQKTRTSLEGLKSISRNAYDVINTVITDYAYLTGEK